jgi:thioredoxin 1
MVERVAISLAISGGLGLLWWAWQYYKTRLMRAIQPADMERGKPTLLYFTGEYCAPCKFQQTPIVEQIRARLGDSVAVKTYDVSAQPDLASRYKVLTLPTTVVLDPQGQVMYVNYGVADQSKLESQLLERLPDAVKVVGVRSPKTLNSIV